MLRSNQPEKSSAPSSWRSSSAWLPASAALVDSTRSSCTQEMGQRGMAVSLGAASVRLLWWTARTAAAGRGGEDRKDGQRFIQRWNEHTNKALRIAPNAMLQQALSSLQTPTRRCRLPNSFRSAASWRVASPPRRNSSARRAAVSCAQLPPATLCACWPEAAEVPLPSPSSPSCPPPPLPPSGPLLPVRSAADTAATCLCRAQYCRRGEASRRRQVRGQKGLEPCSRHQQA